jgi:branched-chain amino acid transport system permease protein
MIKKIFTKVQITVISILLIIPVLILLGERISALYGIDFPDTYYMQLFSFILILTIYSISWNILAYSGQVSLGHAAFLGLGAYSSILLVKNMGLPPLLTIFAGPLFAALIGLGLGLMVLRLRVWFLAMVTFGFSIIVEAIFIDERLKYLTGGWDGLFAKPLITAGLPNYQFLIYYFTAAIAITVYIFSLIIYNSKLGFALKAIEENEALARMSGINTTYYKVLAFVISTYLAGLAGAVDVHTRTLYVSPEIFHLQNSLWPLIFTLIGGLKTAEGPILGTFVVWIVWTQLSGLIGYYALLAIGILLAVIIIFAPKGLIEILSKTIFRILGKQI